MYFYLILCLFIYLSVLVFPYNYWFFLAVYCSLGYKNAVQVLYEEKLLEARREAQQDPHYALDGDVSIIFPLQ